MEVFNVLLTIWASAIKGLKDISHWNFDEKKKVPYAGSTNDSSAINHNHANLREKNTMSRLWRLNQRVFFRISSLDYAAQIRLIESFKCFLPLQIWLQADEIWVPTLRLFFCYRSRALFQNKSLKSMSLFVVVQIKLH